MTERWEPKCDEWYWFVGAVQKKGFEKLLPKEVGEEYEFKSDGAELHIWRVG